MIPARNSQTLEGNKKNEVFGETCSTDKAKLKLSNRIIDKNIILDFNIKVKIAAKM